MENDTKEVSKGGSDFNYSHIDWVYAHFSHDKEVTFIGILNDWALEELVMELTRGEVTLDSILSSAQCDVRTNREQKPRHRQI